ncbi:hypothetical protein PIB30_104724 [Stylosanthes scabra]|uniref:Uncharacterized protein n=1 Tax=Stylosanthes scabra TaxID=79078 RepID=A0ABU6XY00_9FABA|nr:hypothetical protein [Stylosanthes scabra]
MLRKRWVKKLDDLISINLVLPFVHYLVGKALLAGVTDLEAKNCHNQVRYELAYTKLRGCLSLGGTSAYPCQTHKGAGMALESAIQPTDHLLNELFRILQSPGPNALD